MSQLRIYIDFKSAPAYLALGPTIAMLDRLKLDAEWLPFDTRQAAIPPQRNNETRGETHVRVRAIQRQRVNLHYAAVQGIPMNYPDVPVGTRCALTMLLQLDDPLPFVKAAFAAYWQDHRDLDNPEVVASLLVDSGHALPGLDPLEMERQREVFQAESEDLGIFDTPMFLLDGDPFLGREQLPLLESLLLESRR